MGSASRTKPVNLATKLLSIRVRLGFSQKELADQLSFDKVSLRRSDISRYELGLREPSLIVILRYSRLSKIPVETLIDDDLTL